MVKRKKTGKIAPQFIKDKHNKVESVLLKYSVYQSIVDEMNCLKKSIEQSKKVSSKKSKN